MKFKKSKFLFLIVSCTILINHSGKAQQNAIETGYYYSIDISSALKDENNRPVNLHLITSNLNDIHAAKDNIDRLTCSLLTNCKYFIDNEMTILEYMKKFSRYSKDQLRKYIINYEQNESKLYKLSFKHQFSLNDRTLVKVSIQKFKGECWLFDADSAKLNQFSEQIPVSMNCYHDQKYFILKMILLPVKISQTDMQLVLKEF